jgi:RNA polymerase sigma factor (sigma-70 family)
MLTLVDSPSTPHPDTTLVAACLRGDESAWNQLVDKYGRLVYWIARQYAPTPAEADDVVQDVFIKVFKALPQLQKQESLAAWLSTIARREAQRSRKRQKQSVELDENLWDAADPPLEQIHRQVLREQVHLALLQLDPFTREFLLACMSDPPPTYEALAARVDRPVGSIGPTRARCLKKLQFVLEKMGISKLD